MLSGTSRRIGAALIGIAVISMTASCSLVSGWFGDDDPAKPTSVSVFDAAIGDCFVAPAEVKAELVDLSKVACEVEHQQELFARVDYTSPAASDTSAGDDVYPGEATLDTFAKGACAQEFTDYVGIAYPDSGLWITYLLPSARSWQQDGDRTVLCFVTTTGDPLTSSVQGSRL